MCLTRSLLLPRPRLVAAPPATCTSARPTITSTFARYVRRCVTPPLRGPQLLQRVTFLARAQCMQVDQATGIVSKYLGNDYQVIGDGWHPFMGYSLALTPDGSAMIGSVEASWVRAWSRCRFAHHACCRACPPSLLPIAHGFLLNAAVVNEAPHQHGWHVEPHCWLSPDGLDVVHDGWQPSCRWVHDAAQPERSCCGLVAGVCLTLSSHGVFVQALSRKATHKSCVTTAPPHRRPTTTPRTRTLGGACQYAPRGRTSVTSSACASRCIHSLLVCARCPVQHLQVPRGWHGQYGPLRRQRLYHMGLRRVDVWWPCNECIALEPHQAVLRRIDDPRAPDHRRHQLVHGCDGCGYHWHTDTGRRRFRLVCHMLGGRGRHGDFVCKQRRW